MKNRLIYISLLVWYMTSTILAQGIIQDLESKLNQNPNDVTLLVQLGKLYQNLAANGNKEAVGKGMSYLDNALRLDPANGVALAYHGSLWTMRGRDETESSAKLNAVNKGIAEMDKAVELAPTNVSVFVVRGITSIQLPLIFKRLPIAVNDFDHVLSSGDFHSFNRNLQATVILWAGISYKQDHQSGKAKKMFQNAVELVPDSWVSKKATVELKDLK